MNWTPSASPNATPAYSGTAVSKATPGTTSNEAPARTQAAASSLTPASKNGSPATSRATRRPPRAASTVISAFSSGVIQAPKSASSKLVTSPVMS